MVCLIRSRDSIGYAANRRQATAWVKEAPQIVVPCHRPLRYPYNSADPPVEKGIDVELALGAVEQLATGRCDVAIIFSHDTDLNPAVETIIRLKGPRAVEDRSMEQSVSPLAPSSATWRSSPRDLQERLPTRRDPRQLRPRLVETARSCCARRSTPSAGAGCSWTYVLGELDGRPRRSPCSIRLVSEPPMPGRRPAMELLAIAALAWGAMLVMAISVCRAAKSADARLAAEAGSGRPPRSADVEASAQLA